MSERGPFLLVRAYLRNVFLTRYCKEDEAVLRGAAMPAAVGFDGYSSRPSGELSSRHLYFISSVSFLGARW